MSKGRRNHRPLLTESLEERRLLAFIGGYVFTDTNFSGEKQSSELAYTQSSVYVDQNNNGSLDAGEPSTMPSSYGYQFQLSAGTHRIRAVVPQGWVTTPVSDQWSLVTVTENQQIRVDIGIAPLPASNTIQGFMYRDLNVNGKPDGADAYTGSAYVFLDANDNAVRDLTETIVTPDINGNFKFTNLPTSTDTFVLRTMSEYDVATPADRKLVVTLDAARTGVAGISFGLRNTPTSHVSGKLFIDPNFNGVRDTGEEVTTGGAVYVDLNNNGKFNDTEPLSQNDRSGNFTFYYLSPGTYVLRTLGGTSFAPSRASATITVTGTEPVVQDMGLISSAPGLANIRGRVFIDTDRDTFPGGSEVDYAGYGISVYIDANENGVLDAGERSCNASGTGSFGFVNVAPGRTVLRLTGATGLIQTSSTPGVQVVTAVSGQTVNAGFGVIPTYTLYFSVQDDLDGDGVTDAGEAGVGGRTVWADLNDNGALDFGEPSMVTSTTATSISNLTPGTYRFRTLLPNGWQLTGRSTSNTAAPDFAASGLINLPVTNALVYMRLMTFHTQVAPITFYDYTVLGAVYNDVNGNGVKDTSETGIAGRTLYIDANNNGVLDTGERTATSAATGQFGMNGFAPGTYVLRQVVPAGWEQTAPATPYSFTVAGHNASSVNFGSRVIPTPPPTTTVTLEAENATFAGGTVKASNNAGFTGTGFADYAGQNSSATFTLTRSVSDAATLTFRYANGSTANRPLQILVNNVVVGTVACAPTGAWTTWKTVALTNINLPAGAVAIKAIALTSVGGANVDSLTVTAGGTVTPPPPPPPSTTGSISGVLFMDANKNGIFDGSDYYLKDKLVFIDLDGDNAPDSNEKQLLSDSNGKFTFSGLTAGTYKIRRIVPSGYKQTSPLLNVTLTAGQNVSGLKIITVVA